MKRFVKAVGKVVLAIVLGYAGFMVASFLGGMLAGALGVMFRWEAGTVQSVGWGVGAFGFLGTLIFIDLWSKRKKENTQAPKG